MVTTLATSLLTPARYAPVEERIEGNWHVYPLEAALELDYVDQAGNATRRWVLARELKVGPGKMLLGGIDILLDDGYRGFRVDRIQRLEDAETGLAVEHNILDWLMKLAERQARARRKAVKRSTMPSSGTPASDLLR
jgi:predicted DNA-binding transcriptional regulator YafY